MASAVASKGLPLASLVKKVLAKPSGAPGARIPLSSFAATRRLFNSKGCPLGRYDDDDDDDVSSGSEDDVTVDDRRRARTIGPVFFTSADLVDPFGAPTTLGRLLSKLEGAMEASPEARAGRGSLAAPRRGWWVAKEDDHAVTVKVPMPGLEKERVKVRVDKNVLVINGEHHMETEGGRAEEEEEEELRYTHRIELPAEGFKVDQLRAEMKNGLLKVTVPKLKDEERKDVFHVTVE